VLHISIESFGGELADRLRAQLIETMKPVQGLFAAFRAIAHLGNRQMSDVIAAAYVPDPSGFMRVPGNAHGQDWVNYGVNLLDQQPEDQHLQLSRTIAEALAPVRASLGAGRAWTQYVPLARRPKRYVRKGYTTEGLRGDERPFGGDTAAADQRTTVDTATTSRPLPASTGRVRTGYAGQLPPGTVIDGNIAPALVDNLMRGDSYAI
jgi:hypothetical protein